MTSRLELIKTTRPYTAHLIKQLQLDSESLGNLNPTGHILGKAVSSLEASIVAEVESALTMSLQIVLDNGSDGQSDNSPVTITSSSHAISGATQSSPQISAPIQANSGTTQSGLQAPTSLKTSPVQAISEIAAPELFDGHRPFLSRAYTDLSVDYVSGNMDQVPLSFNQGPTSIPMADLAWPLHMHDASLATHSDFMRAGSAPPTSGPIDMSMMDMMDQTALQLNIAQATSGLYTESESAQHTMDYSNGWTSDIRWSSSHG